ncbi:MAG: hypothetical protein IKT46_01650 [Clostridia bacterium]|nr:hypothetical protein [Clostridia bacterium]
MNEWQQHQLCFRKPLFATNLGLIPSPFTALLVSIWATKPIAGAASLPALAEIKP